MSTSKPTVTWDQLRPHSADGARIYSGPLGTERFVLSILEQSPGAASAPQTYTAAETVYVLIGGEATIRIGDESFRAKPFDAFRVPPNTPHHHENDGKADAHWAMMASPVDEFVAASDWYSPGSIDGVDRELSRDGSKFVADSAFGRPPDGSVGAHCGPDRVATAVGWNDLLTYPGTRYRIYSAPLGVENFAFIISRQPARAEATYHAHPDAEEVYVLLSGTGRFRLADDVYDAAPLDGFRAAPEVMHANLNPSDEEIYWLVMASPTDEFVAESDWYRPGVLLGTTS